MILLSHLIPVNDLIQVGHLVPMGHLFQIGYYSTGSSDSIGCWSSYSGGIHDSPRSSSRSSDSIG